VAVLILIVSLGIVGVAAIVAIVALRPHEDNAALIATVLGFLAPTMAALLALIKVQELHLAVNSRLTQLLEQTAKASRSEGREDAAAAAALATPPEAGPDGG